MTDETTKEAIRTLQRQIELNNALAFELEEKIARLETAKGAVMGSYDDITSFVNWIGFYDVGRSWLGENREDFEVKKDETKTRGDDLCNRVEECYEQICRKLEALKQELSSVGLSTASMYINRNALYLGQNCK